MVVSSFFQFNEQLDEDEQDPDDIRNMKESERPAVVVLNEGKDLTVEQLDEEVRKKLEEDDRESIMFNLISLPRLFRQEN